MRPACAGWGDTEEEGMAWAVLQCGQQNDTPAPLSSATNDC